MFKGDQGWILADYEYRTMMLKGDMTHYKSAEARDLIPPSPGHHEGMDQRMQRPANPRCATSDYSGAMIEHNLLALVAYRTGKETGLGRRKLESNQLPRGRCFHPQELPRSWTLNG